MLLELVIVQETENMKYNVYMKYTPEFLEDFAVPLDLANLNIQQLQLSYLLSLFALMKFIFIRRIFVAKFRIRNLSKINHPSRVTKV